MFRKFTLASCAFLSLSVLNYAQTNDVVPSANTTTAGGIGFSLLSTSARSYQELIDSTLLTSLVNDTITGISYRGLSSATTAWPTATVVFDNFDLYMGKAVLIQNATTAVFATNQVGTQTQVRSGSLTIPENSYAAGTSWGPVINFTTPYVYTGGNLSVLLRTTGITTNISNKIVDGLGTTSSGYSNTYKATYEGSYTGTGTTAGNFVILRFTSGSTPLPVDLISFLCSASGYNADIKWETASDKNTKYFVVEKSTDGVRFNALETVQIKDQEGVKEYNLTDFNVFKTTEMVFYRLKMVENDGSFRYSKISKLNNGKLASSNLTIYPNPVKDVCNVSYSLPTEADIKVQVYDMAGRLVYADVMKSSKGKNSVITDFSSLTKGYYILKLTGDGIDDNYKFVKE